MSPREILKKEERGIGDGSCQKQRGPKVRRKVKSLEKPESIFAGGTGGSRDLGGNLVSQGEIFGIEDKMGRCRSCNKMTVDPPGALGTAPTTSRKFRGKRTGGPH